MIQLIRGFKDVLPGEVELWQAIEKTAISVFDDFGFKEIRIPIIEKTELFSKFSFLNARISPKSTLPEMFISNLTFLFFQKTIYGL